MQCKTVAFSNGYAVPLLREKFNYALILDTNQEVTILSMY